MKSPWLQGVRLNASKLSNVGANLFAHSYAIKCFVRINSNLHYQSFPKLTGIGMALHYLLSGYLGVSYLGTVYLTPLTYELRHEIGILSPELPRFFLTFLTWVSGLVFGLVLSGLILLQDSQLHSKLKYL